MNDSSDDLEQRFQRLRPTDLPGGLRRRLFAAEPVAFRVRVYRRVLGSLDGRPPSLPLAWLSLAVVAALFTVWQVIPARLPVAGRLPLPGGGDPQARTHQAVATAFSSSTRAAEGRTLTLSLFAPERGGSLEAASLARPVASYAMLGDELAASPGVFHLDLLTDPVRLDDGYKLPGSPGLPRVQFDPNNLRQF